MRYNVYFFSVCLLFSIFSLKATEQMQNHFNRLITPQEPMLNRVEIARYYVDKKNGLFDINAEMCEDQNFVTGYLSQIPQEDLVLSPNPLIDYFFSQGANFYGQYSQHSKSHPLNLFKWIVQGHALLSQRFLVAQRCLDAKVRCTDLYKKLFTVVGSFKLINQQKSNNIINIKIPRPLTKMIINDYLAQEEAIIDITTGLEQEVCWFRSTPLYCINHYTKLNDTAHEQGIEKDDLKIFDPECWKSNPLELIMSISQKLKTKK